MAKAITDFPKSIPILGALIDNQSDSTGVSGASFPTQTAQAQASPAASAGTTVVVASPTPAPTATPVPEYVKVTNTGGQGVRLRKEPRQNAPFDEVLGEGEVVRIVGPDAPDTNDASIVWRNVSRPSDGLQGYIQKRYLQAAPPPTP
jgi:hypothetical protein